MMNKAKTAAVIALAALALGLAGCAREGVPYIMPRPTRQRSATL
jgi:hypothetical protein